MVRERQRVSKRVATKRAHGKARMVAEKQSAIHKREPKGCYLDRKKLAQMAKL